MTERRFEYETYDPAVRPVVYPHDTIRRVSCAAPTDPGWYYGRGRVVGEKHMIFPFKVIRVGDELLVDLMAGRHWHLSRFDWFGPVPTCVESGT